MHPREQKGACSSDGGFPQIGQGFGLTLLGIPARHGQSSIRAQGDIAAGLTGQNLQPGRLSFKHGDHLRVRHDPLCADALERHAAEIRVLGSYPVAVL